MTAHKGWTTYANVRLLITCDSLEKAKRYQEKYVNTGCQTTDLSSEDEAGERGKRRVRPNPVYMESDGESETSCVKRRFAKPPDVHCPTVLPESSQYPSVPTPNASSAFGGSHSEDVLSIHQADNGFCGSYLAELDKSMDHCNDDGGASNAHGSRLADFSSPGLAHLTPQHPSHPPSAPETPRGRLYGGESSRVLKDIAAMRTTKMLTELCMEVKQISRDINFIKTELAKLNIHGAGPESQEDNFPIMLPLTNEEKFDETEAALREEAARRKMAPWWFVQVCPAYDLFTQALRMSAAVSLGNFTALQEGTLICFTPVLQTCCTSSDSVIGELLQRMPPVGGKPSQNQNLSDVLFIEWTNNSFVTMHAIACDYVDFYLMISFFKYNSLYPEDDRLTGKRD
ncbi:hypothetical protein NQZ68_035839 [Dissostichus eleginoides]|nr:hypothetical protein NQZ68_035839 [Dissostichus eleginoides]